MNHPYLSPRKSGKKTYFHFRVRVPLDLIPSFSGRKEFQISLKDVSNNVTGCKGYKTGKVIIWR